MNKKTTNEQNISLEYLQVKAFVYASFFFKQIFFYSIFSDSACNKIYILVCVCVHSRLHLDLEGVNEDTYNTRYYITEKVSRSLKLDMDFINLSP